MILTLTALTASVQPPADRSYILVDTERPAQEIAQCVAGYWDEGGRSDVGVTAYGFKVDFRFGNFGGAVKDPTVSMEIHATEGGNSLLMYGFGTWRGAIKNLWKQTAKRCYPELFKVSVVKALP